MGSPCLEVGHGGDIVPMEDNPIGTVNATGELIYQLSPDACIGEIFYMDIQLLPIITEINGTDYVSFQPEPARIRNNTLLIGHQTLDIHADRGFQLAAIRVECESADGSIQYLDLLTTPKDSFALNTLDFPPARKYTVTLTMKTS